MSKRIPRSAANQSGYALLGSLLVISMAATMFALSYSHRLSQQFKVHTMGKLQRTDLKSLSIELGMKLSQPDLCQLNFASITFPKDSPMAVTKILGNLDPLIDKDSISVGLRYQHNYLRAMEIVGIRQYGISDPIAYLGDLLLTTSSTPSGDHEGTLFSKIPIYFMVDEFNNITDCLATFYTGDVTYEDTLCVKAGQGTFFDPRSETCSSDTYELLAQGETQP